MNDIFCYNSGSLLQALHPDRHARRPVGEPFIANIAESFLPTVSAGGGDLRRADRHGHGRRHPLQQEGLRRRRLKVPTTWAEFEANNEALKAAGIRAGRRRPTGRHLDLAAVRARGLLQRAGGRPGLRRPSTPTTRSSTRRRPARWRVPAPPGRLRQGLVAEGLRSRHVRRRPEHARRRRDRPVPDAELRALDHRRRTTPTSQGHRLLRPAGHGRRQERRDHLDAGGDLHPQDHASTVDAAKDFLAFIASVAGADAIIGGGRRRRVRTSSRAPTLPDTRAAGGPDIQATSTPATRPPGARVPVAGQGPNLEQITVAVGSGLTSAADGAAQYDQDVEKQAKQLTLPGW